MKIHKYLSTTLFFALMLFVSHGALQAQSTQDQAKNLLEEMPTKAAVQKLSTAAQKDINESIAILNSISKVRDGNSAEAKTLSDRANRLAVALEASAKAECKRGCLRALAACLEHCGSDNLCRALCRSKINWCIIRCHYSLKDTVEETPHDVLPGGKK